MTYTFSFINNNGVIVYDKDVDTLLEAVVLNTRIWSTQSEITHKNIRMMLTEYSVEGVKIISTGRYIELDHAINVLEKGL